MDKVAFERGLFDAFGLEKHAGEHFNIYSSICGHKLDGCRCGSPNKVKKYEAELCDDCKKKQAK